MCVMMKRSHALSSVATGRIALAAIAIAAAASLANPSHANAQSADLVLCDRLAADPSDPDKPADVKGTSDVAPSDVATAIKYCRIAAGSSRHALYQLGRAYAASGQMGEAIAAWRKAADKGSSAAMVELGVLYGTGSGGVGKDEAQARKLFEKAAQAGNRRGGPKDKDAAKAYYERAAALGDDDAKKALERIRCPYAIKDKQGKLVTTL